MADRAELDPKTAQLIEDLRLSVESYKKRFDEAQDENYQLMKKINTMQDESDNKETQIRRLNTKIGNLKAEISKLRSSRNKDKELVIHRKGETLQVIKHVGVILRTVNTLVIDEATAVEDVLDSLLYNASN